MNVPYYNANSLDLESAYREYLLTSVSTYKKKKNKNDNRNDNLDDGFMLNDSTRIAFLFFFFQNFLRLASSRVKYIINLTTSQLNHDRSLLISHVRCVP